LGRLVVDIDDDLEKRLRKRLLDEYGGKRGALKKAIITALEKWLKPS